MSTSLPGPDRPDQHRRGRWVLVIVAVVVTMALAIGATVIITRRNDNAAGPAAPTGPTTTVTTTVTPQPTQPTTPSATTRTPSTSPPSTQGPSAADALSRFFTAARTLDRQLSTAAAAINAAGPPWPVISPKVARLVTAADLQPVARAIPSGLPSDLRAAVFLTYSDLASRRYAMQSFAYAGPVVGADLLRELGNGHAAAVRFDRDLAATKSLASESPAVTAVSKSSRSTAETMLLIQYVNGTNGGCGSRGGGVLTQPPRIVWHHEEAEQHRDGTIGGVWFTATLDSSGEWHTGLFAC